MACHAFRARPFRTFLFQSNFTFQASAWSAWPRVGCQYKLHSWSWKTFSHLIVPTHPPGHSMRLTPTVLCMCGVRVLFMHFAQEYPNIDNTLRQTPRNSSGTLNGNSVALRSDGFSEPCKTASTPLKLRLPAPTRSIR